MNDTLITLLKCCLWQTATKIKSCHAHLDIRFSCMTSNLEIYQSTVLSEFFWCARVMVPKSTTIWTTEIWLFPQQASSAHYSHPHTLPCYILCFTHVFYFMLLWIQVIPAPTWAVTKEAVANWSTWHWGTRASPASPFDPPGSGRLTVTQSLANVLSIVARCCKYRLGCLQVSTENERPGAVYTGGERVTDSNPWPSRLFSFSITECRQEAEERGSKGVFGV